MNQIDLPLLVMKSMDFPSAEEVSQRLAKALEPPSPEFAAKLAKLGIAQSAAHAEAVDEGWHERAYSLLERFCQLQATQPFTSEDFRLYAAQEGFAVPVPKALGAVFKRAAGAGLIRRDGFGKAFARHGSPCPRWRAS